MAADEGLIAWVAEATEPLGTLTKRAMMGGATLYLDGQVFGIVDDDALWLKSDKVSDPEWDAAGCERFSFTASDGSVATMNYRRAPDDVYDDADALRRWAALALEAGLRAPKKAKAARKPKAPKAGSSPRKS
ncbi:TfoX/Sxy family protein [Sphingomonas donggukensis]|uniref:TfoX/Sxy family protein n=1 Tax=Sphingomonas donggukensis TaxID=2949093 RepID=A0ABY4TQM6_9SPHN|nr:TfoX/Sxy family protein [Sphingomonas donggukensis]URW74613.1 TfoX/Sxy family protein [Sphingomonas donggukensis]